MRGDRSHLLDLLKQTPDATHQQEVTNEIAAEFLGQDHPLLASWGRLGQNFMLSLVDSDARIDERHWQDRTDRPLLDTRLQRVQESVRQLAPALIRAIETDTRADRSLRIHACHTRLRELEVLRDALLRERLENPQLKPSEILVTMPDVQAYLPLLREHGVEIPFEKAARIAGYIKGRAAFVSDFWELIPFDNYTVTFQTTGKALKEIIANGLDSVDFDNGQFSGVKVKYQPGVAGAAKIVALTLDDGSAVLVQRGWVPRHRLQRDLLPPVHTPDGPVSLLARVIAEPSRLRELGDPALTGPIRQNLDLATAARETGLTLRPLVLLQLDAPGQPSGTDGLRRDWPAPDFGIERHHGYALQWFALSALGSGLLLWFGWLRPRLSSRNDPET